MRHLTVATHDAAFTNGHQLKWNESMCIAARGIWRCQAGSCPYSSWVILGRIISQAAWSRSIFR
jgi:hypothetical protein